MIAVFPEGRTFLAEKQLSAPPLKKEDKEVRHSGGQVGFNSDTGVRLPNINSHGIFMTTEKKTDWLTSHLLFLKGLKSPSEAQQLFIVLAEKSARSEKEEKIFSTLVKSEKAEEKASAARSEVSSMLASEKEAERKARNHKLITLGLLFEFAELENASREILMGMVIDGALADENQRRVWAKAGKEFLAKKEPGKVSAAPPTAPTPAPAKPAESKRDVRTEPVYLVSGYSDRDAIKNIGGAKYEPNTKSWLVPAGVDLTPFAKWLPRETAPY